MVEQPKVWRPNFFLAALVWAVIVGITFGVATAYEPVEKPPIVPAPPRCEIGWTLHIENGVVIKKVPVVICEEYRGKWIVAKQ